MRFHIITLLIGLICFGEGGGDSGGLKSNIEEVYEKLATITRITNAITLQAEGLRRNVKVRDVIVELLQADPTVFSTLIGYKPENLKSAMTGLLEKMETLNSEVKDKDWNDLETTKAWLEKFDEGAKKFTAHSLDKIRISAYVDYVFNDTITQQFESWITFFSAVSENYRNLQDKTDKTAAESGLAALKNQCKQLLEELTKIDNESIQIIQFTSAVFETIDLLKIYNNTKESFQNTHKDLLNVMVKIFGFTDGIWIDPKLNSSIAAEPFKYAVSNLKEMLKTIKRPEVKLTIGFPERRDISKVSDDLNSEWFQQKVVGGKSVEHLRKELSGFFRFGKLVKIVEDSWEAFATGFQKNEQAADEMSREMEGIEAFTDGPNGEKMLSDFKKHFEKFGNKPMDATKWNDQVKAFADFSELSNAVEKVRGAVPFLVSIKKNKNLDAESEKLEKNTSISVDDFKNSHQFEGLISTMEELKKLNSALSAYKTEHEKYIGKYKTSKDAKGPIIGFMEVLIDFDERFNRTKTIAGFNSTNLIQMITFLKNVRSLSQQYGVSQVMGILEKFSVLRENVFKAESFVKNIKTNYNKEDHNADNPILKLQHPEELLLSLGRGMYVLRDMTRAWTMQNDFLAFKKCPESFHRRYGKFVSSEFYSNHDEMINTLMGELSSVNDFSADLKDKGLMTMRTIFDEAANRVHGFPEVFPRILNGIPTNQVEKEMEIVRKLAGLDLDFASHKGYLQAASLSFDELRMYYDDIFGLNEKKQQGVEEQNYLVPILICIAIFVLIFIGFIGIFGLTKSGRKLYKNWYFYYFAKPEDFEKRWRYSFFMDRHDLKNSLIDAVREINTTNVLKAVKNGAYINVYNDHGNTPLHLATKRCYPEIVEILIKNGANRAALNSKNKTPEQMIPTDWKTNQTTEHSERFEKIEKVYKKYKNKKFRLRVPQEFPSSSYHIFINEKVDDEMAEKFIKKFQAITTNDPIPTTTHCVVKTDSDGIMEIDSMDMVCWINSGVIMIKDSWLADCLENEKLIDKDCEYLVEMVKYKGRVYDTVTWWAQAMARGEMPYLCGVYVVLFIENYEHLDALTTMIPAHGGIFCTSEKMPDKSFFKVGARPYLHAHLGPVFILYDEKSNVEVYRNDPDKMYTLFTEVEFAAFMLDRAIKVDTRPDPIPLVTETEN